MIQLYSITEQMHNHAVLSLDLNFLSSKKGLKAALTLCFTILQSTCELLTD